MRRLTVWIGGAVSGVIAYRFVKRSRRPAVATAPVADETDDRAEELREKLAESRATEEASPVEPDESPDSLEERRRRVHEEGRAAIDEMQGGGEQP
jgi:hypothetical protein